MYPTVTSLAHLDSTSGAVARLIPKQEKNEALHHGHSRRRSYQPSCLNEVILFEKL
jgi:hypothetical protein